MFPRALAPVIASILLWTIGCVSAGVPDLDYQPKVPASTAAAPVTIGVLPLEEGRPPKHLGFLFGAMLKTFIPLLPYSKAPYERLDEYQAEKAREERRAEDAGELFPIAFAKLIAKDLAESGTAREVRMLSGPEEAASVDYVLGGTLRSTERRVNTTTYMLGPLGVWLWFLPIPMGTVAADVELDLSLRDRAGTEVWKHHVKTRTRKFYSVYSRSVTVGSNPSGSSFRLQMKRYGRNREGITPNSYWAYHASALRKAMAEVRPLLAKTLSARGGGSPNR